MSDIDLTLISGAADEAVNDFGKEKKGEKVQAKAASPAPAKKPVAKKQTKDKSEVKASGKKPAQREVTQAPPPPRVIFPKEQNDELDRRLAELKNELSGPNEGQAGQILKDQRAINKRLDELGTQLGDLSNLVMELVPKVETNTATGSSVLTLLAELRLLQEAVDGLGIKVTRAANQVDGLTPRRHTRDDIVRGVGQFLLGR